MCYAQKGFFLHPSEEFCGSIEERYRNKSYVSVINNSSPGSQGKGGAASPKERSAALAVPWVKCQGGILKHLQMNTLLTKQESINTHFWMNSVSLNEVSDPTLLNAIL